jgi:anti-sigma factor RsiW
VHIINLFCAPAPGSGNRAATMESLQGYNLRRWSENGINLWAVTTSVPTNSASSARNSRRR